MVRRDLRTCGRGKGQGGAYYARRRLYSVRIYPSADYAAVTTLYEDDTKTVGYKDGQFRTTDIDMQCDGNARTIRIGAAQGTFGGDRACTDRLWNVRLHRNPTWGDVRSIRVNGVTQSAETVAAVTYAEKGRPFAYAGGALDGDIDTLALRTQVSRADIPPGPTSTIQRTGRGCLPRRRTCGCCWTALRRNTRRRRSKAA